MTSNQSTFRSYVVMLTMLLCSSFQFGFLFMAWSSAAESSGLREELYLLLPKGFSSHTEELTRGILNSLLIIGFGVGCFLYSFRDEEVSRLRGMQYSMIIMIACTFCGTLNNVYKLMLPLTRYFVGIALAFSMGFASEFILEILPERRQWMVVPLQVCSIIIGSFCSSLLSYFELLNTLQQLRYVICAQIMIYFIGLLLLCIFAVESPVFFWRIGQQKLSAESAVAYFNASYSETIVHDMEFDLSHDEMSIDDWPPPRLIPMFASMAVAFSGTPILLLYPNIYLLENADYKSTNLMCISRVAGAFVVAFMALFGRRDIVYSKPRIIAGFFVAFIALVILVFVPLSKHQLFRVILVVLQIITLGENSAVMAIELFFAVQFATKEIQKSCAAWIGLGCLFFGVYVGSMPFFMVTSNSYISFALLSGPLAVNCVAILCVLPSAPSRKKSLKSSLEASEANNETFAERAHNYATRVLAGF